MHCVGCGTELKKDQKFCPSCGMVVNAIDSTKTGVIPRESREIIAPRVVTPAQKIHSPKRRGGKIFVIFLIIALVGSGIFGIITAANWGVMEGSADYLYENASPSSVESLHLDVETSDITINYVNSPSAPVVEINMDYYIAGGFVSGKQFNEIFEFSWDNTSAVKTFYLHTKPFLTWIMIRNIDIVVTLRSDVTYDIEVDTITGATILNIPDDAIVEKLDLRGITGSININAGSNVTFEDSITARVITGGITLSATDSSFGSDITLTSTTGSIALDLDNPQYQSDQTWDFTTVTGSIDVEIYQYTSMLNDITADFHTTTGDIIVDYNGNNTLAGASFTSSLVTGDLNYINSEGFSVSSSLFESLGFDAALNKYTVTASVTTGDIQVTGTSS